jgi:hypothetical protein
MILLCARRRLLPEEFLAAVTVDPLTGEVMVSSIADLLDACCDLVILDHEVGSFRFAHLSVREFLEGRSDYDPTITHLFVMNQCLSVFLCKSGDIHPASTPAQIQFLNEQNESFRRYATASWIPHFQLSQAEVEQSRNLEIFAGSDGYSSGFTEWYHSAWSLSSLGNIKGFDTSETDELRLRSNLERICREPPSIILLSCVCGLGAIIRYFMPRKGIDWNRKTILLADQVNADSTALRIWPRPHLEWPKSLPNLRRHTIPLLQTSFYVRPCRYYGDVTAQRQ